MMSKTEEEIREILKKHNLKISYEISFPKYKILPDEVQLALKILAKNGMKILFTLTPTTIQKQSK